MKTTAFASAFLALAASAAHAESFVKIDGSSTVFPIVEAIAAHDPAAARQHALRHLARGRQRLAEGGVLPDGRHGKTNKTLKEKR